MRKMSCIIAILCSTVAARGEEWVSAKSVCSGRHAPAGLSTSSGLVLGGAGVGDVAAAIPPGFKPKTVYCEMYDPAYGLKACKYSKKADKSCPDAVSKGMLIQDFKDGYKTLRWYVDSKDVGRPRTFFLSADVVPEFVKDEKAKGKAIEEEKVKEKKPKKKLKKDKKNK